MSHKELTELEKKARALVSALKCLWQNILKFNINDLCLAIEKAQFELSSALSLIGTSGSQDFCAISGQMGGKTFLI